MDRLATQRAPQPHGRVRSASMSKITRLTFAPP